MASDPDSGFADIDADDLPEPQEGQGGEMGPESMAGFAGGEVEEPERPAMGGAQGARIDDVDKAGAVYGSDTVLDADEKWCTSENGKHFQVNTENGEIIKGNVGQEDGPAIERQKAIQAKIDSIRIELGKDNVLPNLNAETLKEIGKPDKPVLLKKSVIERNSEAHSDVPLEESSRLIGEALYNPVHVVRANAEKDYLNFIGIDKQRHGVVLLDVEEGKDNFEIVHWHYVRPRSVKRLVEKGHGHE